MTKPNKDIQSEPTLFHYCSTETFLNIIANKTLRLSDISKSNDYKETKWLFEYIEDEVIKQFEAAPFFHGEYIRGLSEIETVKLIVRNVMEKMKNRSEELMYVSCFSKDDDKLSQWRGYADDGNGLAIGFNYHSLNTLISKCEELNLMPVLYPEDIDAASQEIKDYSKRTLDSIHLALANDKLETLLNNEYGVIDFSHELSSRTFIRKSISFKNPAFKEENEWRIVFNGELSKSEDWDYWYDSKEGKPRLYGEYAELFPKGLQFRAQKNKIVSFFDLSFNGFEESIIDSITIGPKSEIQESDLDQLLGYYGYDITEIKINKSTSTYR